MIEIGRIDGTKLAPFFIHALNDPVDIVRLYAAEALGRIGDEKAEIPLLTLLESENCGDVRSRVAFALFRLGKLSPGEVRTVFNLAEAGQRTSFPPRLTMKKPLTLFDFEIPPKPQATMHLSERQFRDVASPHRLHAEQKQATHQPERQKVGVMLRR